jgi:arginase
MEQGEIQPRHRAISLLLMPYHDGRRGVGMGLGPLRLVQDGRLAEELSRDGRQVHVEDVEPVDESAPEMARVIELDRRLADRVRTAAEHGSFPLVLAGNCNSCLGTVAGISPVDSGVVWFDAHADLDTPDDNVSGFFDVMGLSILTGSCFQSLAATIPGFRPVDERRVVLVGARDLAPYQAARLSGSQVGVVYDEDLRRAGARTALARALDRFDAEVSAVYLHVDLDCLDPAEGIANAYAAPGGLRRGELEDAIGLVFERFEVTAAALTAYDPAHDGDGRMMRAAQRLATVIAGHALQARRTAV